MNLAFTSLYAVVIVLKRYIRLLNKRLIQS